jgi:DNA replication protein DnaC
MEWLIFVGLIWIVYAVEKNAGQKSKKNDRVPHASFQGNINNKLRLNEKRIDFSKMTLSSEQKELFNKIENTKENIFITGKAGTGKSLLLQYFKQKSKKRFVVAAPTGVAALNVGAQTIHSLFRIPPAFIKKDSLTIDPRTATLLRNVDTVVIDEISMVRADLMDAIDHRLRQARSNSAPFGGVQLVMFGDLFQLPPVVNDKELHRYFEDTKGGYFFFNADAWKNVRFEIYELTQIFRQKDERFKTILNAIREGDINEGYLQELNQRTTVAMPTEGVITLATTNAAVEEINHTRLAQLADELHEYRASISGNLEESSYPTEEILRLKKGAQVMLLKNDRDKRWVNGTLGSIHSLTDTEVKVDIDGIVYSVPRETWKKIRYYYDRSSNTVEEETVSSFTQFPLRLAWAKVVPIVKTN